MCVCVFVCVCMCVRVHMNVCVCVFHPCPTDRPAVVTLRFASTKFTVNEGDGQFMMCVLKSAETAVPVPFLVIDQPGSATEPAGTCILLSWNYLKYIFFEIC